jgi:hypothetical protein
MAYIILVSCCFFIVVVTYQEMREERQKLNAKTNAIAQLREGKFGKIITKNELEEINRIAKPTSSTLSPCDWGYHYYCTQCHSSRQQNSKLCPSCGQENDPAKIKGRLLKRFGYAYMQPWLLIKQCDYCGIGVPDKNEFYNNNCTHCGAN